MAKVLQLLQYHPDGSTEHGAWTIQCPACGCWHPFDSRWSFNGDMENPTFRPSMLVHAHGSQPRCHSFVTDGKIEFQGDCDHAMAGKTVELPEIE